MNDNIKVNMPPANGKIDISSAEVLESKINKSSDSSNSQDVYVENLENQKTINLNDLGKKEAGESTTIDFMKENFVENLTSQKTKRSEAPIEEESQFKDKTTDKLKEEIKQAEKDSVKNFSAKDFEDIAKFIIFLIDTSLSTAFKWWSGDSSDSAYSLGQKKQDMLVYQLTLILVKYQAKFSIEFMFLASICLLYAPAFMLAKNRKKEIKQIKLNNAAKIVSEKSHLSVIKKDEKIIQQEAVINNGFDVITNKTNEIKEEVKIKTPGVKPLRSQGRAKKI